MKSICLQDWEIRALQEGRKKQFRVLVRFRLWKDIPVIGMIEHSGFKGQADNVHFWSAEHKKKGAILVEQGIKCPFGGPGDKVFVKETWRCQSFSHHTPSSSVESCDYSIGYKVGWGQYPHCKNIQCEKPKSNAWPRGKDRWNSPVTMPHWASRFTLLIKSVRVERVNEISEEDARAEGVDHTDKFYQEAARFEEWAPARCAFRKYWQRRHPGSWERGDFVWVAKVERV